MASTPAAPARPAPGAKPLPARPEPAAGRGALRGAMRITR